MSELKQNEPCQFCRKVTEISLFDTENSTVGAYCKACGASSPTVDVGDYEEWSESYDSHPQRQQIIDDTWNRRAPEPGQPDTNQPLPPITRNDTARRMLHGESPERVHVGKTDSGQKCIRCHGKGWEWCNGTCLEPPSQPEPGQPDQIRIGQHWLEVAYERLQGGEPEIEVLKDYGYVREETDQSEAGRYEISWETITDPITGETTYRRADSQPEAGRHPDDIAVDKFAAVMKTKLAKKRADGRGGWEDKSQCSESELSYMLIDHLRKGDPIDIGNFAMMLQQRGERIVMNALPDWLCALGKPSSQPKQAERGIHVSPEISTIARRIQDEKDLAELRQFFTRDGVIALLQKYWPDLLVEQGEAEPVADQEALSKMNAWLCDFYKRWRQDGDLLRCWLCQRGHIASKAGHKFVHASGCPAEDTSEDYPWQVLLRLLRPLYTSPAPRAAVLDEVGWLIESGSVNPKYLTMRQGNFEWTPDHNEALRFCRRIDAERIAEECEDAWSIREHMWSAAAPEQGGVR